MRTRPLHMVAYYNDVAILSALMPFVASIDVPGNLDLTPLASAVVHGTFAAAAYSSCVVQARTRGMSWSGHHWR